MDATSPSPGFALVGPGRAGTAVALALAGRGWRPVAVAGRSLDASSTRALAARLGAPVVEGADAGREADVVVVATPDAAIAAAAAELAPAMRDGALVVHLSGAATLHELDGVLLARPAAEVGSLHPLQSLPSGEVGARRLAGSWCAVDGSPRVEKLALSLGMRPFRVAAADRVRYHAAACVASNHLVALLGQVERLAAHAGVPFEAFLPLVRGTIENVDELGPNAALTGPVARGDHETVARHLDALPEEERDAYRALVLEAERLATPDKALA
ncbi:MAG TPA: Rossmann-like and DUF2520 domain-containing protein [Acidimicrobiia bacterium]|nr:Rossmann-like and DUF2520 domain-containing protein [Acidimicrobiia bacterium]